MGAGGDRVRRGARRPRRPRRAPDQGPVALRRRARQPGGFRQLRLRAGADRLPLGPARSRQCRLDRRDGVCDLRRAAARPLQRDDRRSEPPALGRQFLHRRAGAGRRARGDAADLHQSARRAEVRGDDHAALYARDRIPDGVAVAGVLRQARRQARAAGNGAAGVRAGGAVLRAADRLSVVGAVDRHDLLSRLPAARLGLLQGVSAQGRDERGAGDGARPTSPAPDALPPRPAEDPERPARLN